MILDKSLLLSDAQAVTTTAASTNIIDTAADGQALEPGAWIYAAVSTAFVMTGSAAGSLITTLQTGDTVSMDVTLATSATITEADLVAGKVIFKMKLPIGLKRYIRLYYTPLHTCTAGNIDAGILLNVPFLITDDDND